MIDTATGYNNVEDVSSAIAGTPTIIMAKFNRNDLSTSDSVCAEASTRDSVCAYVQKLGKIPEIILLHSSFDTHEENLAQLQKLQARFPDSIIGVSNFDIARLTYLIEHGFTPQIISLEYSPFYQPHKLLDFCWRHNIVVTGYRCLAKGQALTCPIILQLAEKYKTNPTSILLSWSNTDICN